MNKAFKDPDLDKKIDTSKFVEIKLDDNEINDLSKDLGFKDLKEREVGGEKVKYSFTNKLGYLGSWITHLSIIVIIVAFAIGRYQGYEEFIYGVPGTVLDLENSSNKIRIDDFDILFREDFTVIQYITDLTVLNGEEEVETARAMVNHPVRADGFNIYQNSTGWAVDAILYKNDKLHSNQTLYKSEFYRADDDKIALQFVDFYPDLDESDPSMPRTKSPIPNHPVLLYALYYDGMRVDMGLVHMGDQIEYEEYAFLIDNPDMFTLLQVTNDPGKPLALVGGILLLLGLFLAFYVNPKELIIMDTADDDVKKIYVKQGKKDKIFDDKVNKVLEERKVIYESN